MLEKLSLCLRARNIIPAIMILIGLLCHQVACADIRIPKFFSSHMVLQQKMPIEIWGWANPNEQVTVNFAGKTQDLMDAVDHDMLRENAHSTMAINKPDRQSRVTFGGSRKN